MTADPKVFQQLIDQLTALAPLVQRLHVTSRQNTDDSLHALHATEKAVALLQQMQPGEKDGGAV